MTSIAVTASICASASEAALLLASFMPFSLDLASQDLGMTHRCADAPATVICFTRNTPRRVFALVESPLSEYRPCQNRPPIRRHFGSLAAGLCTRDGILEADPARGAGAPKRRPVDPAS